MLLYQPEEEDVYLSQEKNYWQKKLGTVGFTNNYEGRFQKVSKKAVAADKEHLQKRRLS